MTQPPRDPIRQWAGDRLNQATWGRRALSWLYRAGRTLHHGAYERGVLTRGRLNGPVVCVGNLTVGGTGKTPLLIELTRQFEDRGYRPAILSRGYGSRPPARDPRIVSDGQGYFADVERAGDEPLLIARRCPNAPVIIGAKRFSSGLFAEREFHPDLYLLDDGFQHEALSRDVDLVLWDARDLPSELRLLPAGRLREPLSALERASALILTHMEYLEGEAGQAHIRAVAQELAERCPALPHFRMRSRLEGIRPLKSEGGPAATEPLSALVGESVFLVSGLARPEGFETMVRGEGLDVAGHLRLPDHAAYSAQTVEDIRTHAGRLGARHVLTTAKDAVKLERLTDDPLFGVVELKIQIEDEEAWSGFLDGFAPSRQPKEAEAADD